MFNEEDFMKSDLCNESVEIYGTHYTITNQPIYDQETNTISCLAVNSDNQKVLLLYEALDPNDPDCYDVEEPYMIIDSETEEVLFDANK